MQEAGRHGGDVHLEIDEEVGDFERVGEVRLAGGALLTLVRRLREPVGALQHVQVGARLVLWNRLDQGLELGHVAIAFLNMRVYSRFQALATAFFRRLRPST